MRVYRIVRELWIHLGLEIRNAKKSGQCEHRQPMTLLNWECKILGYVCNVFFRSSISSKTLNVTIFPNSNFSLFGDYFGMCFKLTTSMKWCLISIFVLWINNVIYDQIYMTYNQTTEKNNICDLRSHILICNQYCLSLIEKLNSM